MRFPSYYVIHPRPELLKRLQEEPDDCSLTLLGEPRLWQRSEGGKTVWGESDYIHLVKLQFLANWFSTDWYADVRAEIHEFLGPPPYRAETFDLWWTIERFSVDQNADKVWDELELDALSLLDAGDNGRVASLLARRREALEARTERHRQVLLRLHEAAAAVTELLHERFPGIPCEVALPKDAVDRAIELVASPPISFVALGASERPVNAVFEEEWPARADVLQIRFKELHDLNPERIEVRFEFRRRLIETGEAPVYDVFEDHSGTAHVEIELWEGKWTLRNRFLTEKPVHRWRR